MFGDRGEKESKPCSGGEAAVARDASRGDHEALADLFERYRSPLTGFLARLTRDSHAACDLAQETFVRALLGIRRLQRPEGFRAWLFRIAFHVAIDWRRRQGRAWIPLDGPNDGVLAVAGDDAAILEEQERNDVRARVRRGVRAIPETYALVLLLHYFGGLTCREMAEVTQLTVGNVKIRLFRARQALRRRLREAGLGERSIAAHGWSRGSATNCRANLPGRSLAGRIRPAGA